MPSPPASGPPPPPLPPSGAGAAPPDAVRWIQENFEAVVVAFIMALLIRCFCFEVFKIPTASMEPTLLGDAPERDRGGDRIIVNKFAYEFGEVERYDVVVFKFPLDLTRNFIKRVVGLPDEDFRFRDGDIYARRKGETAFALARKPVRVQEGIWIPVSAWAADARGFRDRWRASATDNWQFVQGALHTFAGPGKAPEARFDYVPARMMIDDIDPDRAGSRERPHLDPDIRLSARVEFLGPRGEFDLTVKHDEGRPRERVFRVVLRPGARLRVEAPDPAAGAPPAVRELAETVPDGAEVAVSLLVYDGAVAVLLNGRVVHDEVYRSALPADGESVGSAQVAFGTRGAEVVVRDVAVARDLYYFVSNPREDPLPPEGVHIPPDSYLLVGDNIRNSHDGRAWRRVEVEFTDGTSVLWDANLFRERPTDAIADKVPPDHVVFLRKSESNPHATEIGWTVPAARVKAVRRPRLEVTPRSGEAFAWPEDDEGMSLIEWRDDGLVFLQSTPDGAARRVKFVRWEDLAEGGGLRHIPGVTWVERRHLVGKAFAIWWPRDRWFRLIR